METNLTQLVSDRLEIADALHRYAFGLDHNDADALASAFTENCTTGAIVSSYKGVGWKRARGSLKRPRAPALMEVITRLIVGPSSSWG